MRQLRKFYRDLAAKEIENGGYKITTTIDQKIHAAMQMRLLTMAIF